MSVTASRLGSAPLSLDWSHLTSLSAGTARPGMDVGAVNAAWSRLKARFNDADVGFYDAPLREEMSAALASVELAERLLKSNQFTDCLFLGIGGSSLGPVSLLEALTERRKSRIRIHFMENPDPLEWKATIAELRPESTLVCVVTKSGGTFETLAQFLLALEWLGKERIKTHIVAITDPAKGDLRTFATQNGIPTLPIAPAMGGRFSIFTPVGLFPAALAGLSVTEFLHGAKQVRDYVEKAPVEKNPIFILGADLIRHYETRDVHVCMPYSTRLKSLGAWFVQLWGESLGKDGKGFTPLAAVGAVDQHSILQLLRDGPDDKITFFVTVDQIEDEVRIPKLPFQVGLPNLPAFRLLEGHTLHHLLRVEYRATALVLTKQGRPNLTLQIERLDERSMGALYFAMAMLTAFTGTLWNVNPFDQPGVEEAKVYIRESLSQGNAGGAAASHDNGGTPLREWEDNSPVGRLRRDRDAPNS